jgi:hypothetical protein
MDFSSVCQVTRQLYIGILDLNGCKDLVIFYCFGLAKEPKCDWQRADFNTLNFTRGGVFRLKWVQGFGHFVLF